MTAPSPSSVSTPTRSMVIRGGLVLTESGEQRVDVLIDGHGVIEAVGEGLSGEAVLEADGCIVAPGLVDLHAHLRQPGDEEAETIETGSRAAALGGYTAVVAMPDTDPAVDSAGVVREVRAYAEKALCEIVVAGTITVGRNGEQLAPMGEMAALGVQIFTDSDRGVQDDRLMRRAMEYASGLGVTLALHCDVESLSRGGHMNEGEWSSRLGLPGIPAEAEELMVVRDIALSRLTGAHIHFQHLSTAGSLAMADAARRQGLEVTADVTPHHFTLTEQACRDFDARFKVRPPLRTMADVDAVKAALKNGSVDAIATAHSPLPEHRKDEPFDQAPAGMIGLETALAVTVSEVDLPFADLVRLMSTRPAQIAGLSASHGGPVAAGRPANLMIFDPAAEWEVDRNSGASLSRNTPFAGMKLRGRVRHTIVDGEIVVMDGEATR